MKQEEITRNLRTERAFRRISSGLMFFAVAVTALIVLSAYLKFKPAVGEEITDGKFKQFLDDSFKNRAMIKLALLSVIAGVSCFLPAKLASGSLFAAAGTYAYYIHVRSTVNIETYPNGYLMVYTVFFGAALCCAALRMKNQASMGKEPPVNALSLLSSAILLGSAALSFKLDSLTRVYAEYNSFGRLEENAEEMDFGEFEMIVSKLELNAPDTLVRYAIILIFVALITLVLSRFPRLSVIAPAVIAGYSLYIITVEKLVSMSLVFFIMSLMALAAVIAIPASRITPVLYPDPDEFDENGDEDDGEDDAEYEENRKELEKNGLEMEEF